MFTPDSCLAAFSYILEISPFHLLAYYPFRDNLRFPAWLVFLIAGSNMFLEFLTCCYLYSTGQTVRIADLFFALTSMVIYFSCVKAERPKLIFIYILIVDYTMIVRGISIFLMVQFFYEPNFSYALLGSPVNTIIRLIPCILTTPFMLYFLSQTKKQVLRSNAPKLWNSIWLLPALTTLIVLSFTWNLESISLSSLAFLTARVCLLIMTIIIYYILINSLESLRLQGEAEERARSQEYLVALQRIQYERFQKQIEDTRQAQHDLRQHLNLIQAYLDKGDNETLKTYIKKYGQKLPPNTGRIYSSNYAVDTIIRYYAEKAENDGIRFETNIHLPEKLLVDEPDLCILFGNLLENALDSCHQITTGEPFIRIHTQVAGECAISITIDNSCHNMPVWINDQIISSKRLGNGIGTLSVRNIAVQYHGIADFRYKNEVFYASIFLNPQQIVNL